MHLPLLFSANLNLVLILDTYWPIAVTLETRGALLKTNWSFNTWAVLGQTRILPDTRSLNSRCFQNVWKSNLPSVQLQKLETTSQTSIRSWLCRHCTLDTYIQSITYLLSDSLCKCNYCNHFVRFLLKSPI